MPPKPSTYTLRVVITQPPETLMDLAETIGQNNGRDHDWKPDSFDEGILELILFGDGHLAWGVRAPNSHDSVFYTVLKI